MKPLIYATGPCFVEVGPPRAALPLSSCFYQQRLSCLADMTDEVSTAADVAENISVGASTTTTSENGFEHLSVSEADPAQRSDRSAADAAPEAVPARQPHQAVQSVSATDSASLSTGIDGLVLFDLTNKPDGNLCFSPHTIKTILDLKLLNVGYERQKLSFVQIRNDLASRVTENVTVPVLELSDGSHIVDSWSIAEWLEARHPEGYKLFGNSATKRLAAMLNSFGKTVLAPHIGPLVQPAIHALLDSESASYFADVKIGKTRWAKVTSMTRDEKDKNVEQAVARLQVVSDLLTCEGNATRTTMTQENGPRRSGRPKSTYLAGGDEPTHADFVLFGWYVFTRVAGPRVTNDIWYAHKPIGNWVTAMLQWSGTLADDFV